MAKTRFFMLLAVLIYLSSRPLIAQNADLESIITNFVADYTRLGVRELDFDYRINLQQIPPAAALEERQALVWKYRSQLEKIGKEQVGGQRYRQLAFFLDLCGQRFALEKQYRANPPDKIPQDGLYALPDGTEWYRFYVRYWTGTNTTPEEVYRYGLAEVRAVEAQIRAIRERQGYGNDSLGWVRHLQGTSFFLTDEDSIRAGYGRRQQIVRQQLDRLFEPSEVNGLRYRQWPDAGPYTPPGIYLSAESSATGQPEFLYNFYGGRHNRRAMDWLFIHEGIPGHHYHAAMRATGSEDALADLYFPAGTPEGWATYMEYFGDQVGLYQDDYAWLGKWEWDLVRSVRIVLSVGINYMGWTKEQARAYWNAHLPDQQDIADREITNRCTHWCGQVLSYKIGAKKIFDLRRDAELAEGKKFDLKRFHTRFLKAGMIPLECLTGY